MAKAKALEVAPQTELETGNIMQQVTEIDSVGKIPLAVQQISLAITRMKESGDDASAKLLTNKLKELTKDIAAPNA